MWRGVPSSLNSPRSWVNAEEVAAVGESGDAEGTPGPGGNQPAFCWIDGGERPGRMPACRAGVGAHGEDGGRDHVSGCGDDVHLVRLGHAGGLGGNFQRLVPAPRVDVRPPEHGQAPAAGARTPGARSRCMASCSKRIARSDSSRSHAAEADSPQRGLFNGRVGDLAQVREELVSAADRVGAGAYPESAATLASMPGAWPAAGTLAFQQAEDAADGLAAGGRSGLVGDRGCTPERVPGQGRQVTRCLFGDGDER